MRVHLGLVTTVGVLLLAGPAGAGQDPPPGAPPGTVLAPSEAVPARSAAAARPPAPPPVLPKDARELLDQLAGSLIQQLYAMRDLYLARQRPDDATAVEQQIQLLRVAANLPEDPSARSAARIDLSHYRDRIGDTFQFSVTGSADLPVWGTGIYTDDTPLESAAVHAGVLRSGQTGPVRVTILPPQKDYTASRQHGIESFSSATTGGSYRIETGGGTSTASHPTSIFNFRGRVGETFSLPVLGSTSGQVWGSGLYTDDSELGAAAVHAGLLKPGEFGFVNVTVAAGEDSYPGVERNGVRSSEYGQWDGSMRLAAAPRPWTLRLPDDVVDASGMVNLSTLRSQAGLSFSLKVMGARGTVRGTGIYSDDSSIAAAAVHAGVLRLGESGYVRVTVRPGQASYVGSDQNNLKSVEGGPAPGSFSVERATER